MPILKSTATDGGAACGYHRLINFRIDVISGIAIAHYQSYLDEQSYLLKKQVIWNFEIAVALASLTTDVINSIEAACVANGPLAGGTVIADNGDTLEGVKARKLKELSDKCALQIVGGFTSSALGAPYTYPAKPLDQSNLSGSVLASILPGVASDWTTPFWCADNANAWAFRSHTAAQIQQVGQDAKTALLTAMGKNETLAGKVQAAADIASVNAIVW